MDRRVNYLSVAWGINAMAFSMVFPFLTIYLYEQRGLSMSVVGTVLLLRGLARLPTPVIAGSLVDTIGRRRVLIFGPAARSVCLFVLAGLVAIAAPLWALASGLLASAFIGGFFQTASDTYIADITRPEQRPDAYSRVRVGMNLGWMIGPACGALLARTPYSLLFAAAGLLCLVSVAIAVKTFPETLHGDQRQGRHAGRRRGFDLYRALLEDRAFLATLICTFALYLLASQLISTFSIYSRQGVGISKLSLGYLYAFNGLLVILFQIPLNRCLGAGRLGGRLVAGSLLYAGGYFAVGLGANVWHLAGAVSVFTLGEMLAKPAIATTVSHLAPPDKVGRYMGSLGLVRGVAMSVGPFLGGLAFDRFADRPPLMWALLAASAVVAAAGFHLLHRRRGGERTLAAPPDNG